MLLSPNVNIKGPPTHCKLLKGEKGYPANLRKDSRVHLIKILMKVHESVGNHVTSPGLCCPLVK